MNTNQRVNYARLPILLLSLLFLGLPVSTVAQTVEEKSLRVELEALKKRERETQGRIEALEKALEKGSTGQPSVREAKENAANVSPIDRAVQSIDAGSPPKVKRPADFTAVNLPGALVRNLNVSFAPLIAAGGSSASEEEIEGLEGGAHDPNKNGFTLQQAELSLGAAVDPYFTAEAHFVFLEGEGVETEEAFMTTTALPAGFELEVGKSLAEFGLINPTHAHAWDFIDQPVVSTRFFGGDGSRAVGTRVSKLLPLPWTAELHLGMLQSDDESMASFRGSVAHDHEEEGHSHVEAKHGTEDHDADEHADEHAEEGHSEAEDDEHAHEEDGDMHDEDSEEAFEGLAGRPVVSTSTNSLDDFVYLARLDNFFDLSDETGAKIGFSSMYGPNTSGPDADTLIYGTDLLVKWVPVDNFRGYPFIKFQSEVIARRYEADEALSDEGDLLLAEDTLNDWGFYSQLLYGFTPGWSVGARVELAEGSGESVGGTAADSLRDDRIRLSPLLSYRPTEFSRIRLQYNYDDADHLDSGDAHSIWVGFDALLGTHPAHRYGQS